MAVVLGMLLAATLMAAPGTAQGSVSKPTPVTGTAEGRFSANAVGPLVNKFNGKCLEILNYSTADGAAAGQWGCYGGDNQQWVIGQWSDGYLALINVNSSKCLEILNYSKADGAAAGQWECYGGDNQKWILGQWADGYFALINKHSGRCLEILNYSTADGTAAGQWECYGGDNQKWL